MSTETRIYISGVRLVGCTAAHPTVRCEQTKAFCFFFSKKKAFRRRVCQSQGWLVSEALRTQIRRAVGGLPKSNPPYGYSFLKRLP
jgi:hypothetical protein